MSKVNIFALIIGLALLIFSLFQLNAYSGAVIETYSSLPTDKNYEIPYIQIEDTSTTPFATALIVHGVMENKTSMKHIATSLAHLGIDVYIIDLPGYGDSKISYKEKELNRLHSINYFFKWLENNDKILNGNFVLIGHSIGADAVVRASVDKENLLEAVDYLEYSPDQIKLNLKYLIPEADTTILMSHFPDKLITKNSPKNIFMLLEGLGRGSNLQKVNRFLSNGLKLSRDDNTQYETTIQISADNKFKVKMYPPSNSLDIIYRQDVINDISRWIINYYNIDLTTLLYYNPSTLRNLSLIGILISFILLIFPISELISKLWIFDFSRPKEPYRTERYFSIFFKNLFSFIVAGGLSMIFVLFGFIKIEIVDLITTIFLYQFIINLFIFRNYIFTAAKYDTQIIAKIILAVLISAILYLLIGIISDMYLTKVMFIPNRLWRFVIVYIVFVLYFVSDEFLYRTSLVRYNSDIKTYIKSFLLSFIDKGIIMLGVFLLSYFYFKVSFELLVKFTVVIGILLFLIQIISIYLFRKIKSYYVTGFLNAFILAWIMTAITPITA